jgi:hypothetical protein
VGQIAGGWRQVISRKDKSRFFDNFDNRLTISPMMSPMTRASYKTQIDADREVLQRRAHLSEIRRDAGSGDYEKFFT